MLSHVYLCVPYDFQNSQRLFHVHTGGYFLLLSRNCRFCLKLVKIYANKEMETI
jgi:hypothetical protein